jgi:thymidylate synthase
MNLIFNSNLNHVIGLNNGNLIYDFNEDKKYFKSHTSTPNKQNILICGTKTFATLPIDKILSNGRKLWVITHQTNMISTENIKYLSFEDAIIQYNQNKNNDNYFYWVIGGTQIYKLFEPYVNKVYHCEVQHKFINNYCITYKLPQYFKLCDINETIICHDKISKQEFIVIFKTYIKSHNRIISINTNNIDENNIEISLDENIIKSKHQEYQYLNMLKKTLSTNKRMTRNGYTYSYFGDMIRFDLTQGFPLLTTKKMFFKGIIYELLFFIRGQTDSKILETNGVNIWKGNTSREFLDSVGHTDYNVGEMGPMYGYQWRHFNGKIDQLKNVLYEIETNPMSRRLLMTVFNPEQVDLGVLYPCHSIVTQFYLNELQPNVYEVSISMYQRSADIFLGLPFNIASTALLLEIICHYLNHKQSINRYVPKEMIINLGDVHLYESHIKQALEQIDRIPFDFCKLNIKNSYSEIDEYEFDDFEIFNYQSHHSIKADMVA